MMDAFPLSSFSIPLTTITLHSPCILFLPVSPSATPPPLFLLLIMTSAPASSKAVGVVLGTMVNSSDISALLSLFRPLLFFFVFIISHLPTPLL